MREREEPIDMDDDEDYDEPPRRRIRARSAGLRNPRGLAGLWGVGKYLMALVSAGLFLKSLGEAAPWAAAFAGLACCAGIAARICQAEEHWTLSRIDDDD